MAEKRDRISQIESRWALFEAASRWFPPVGAAVSFVLAIFTDFMAAWAPLSWFVAGMLGWFLVVLVQVALSLKQERDERVRRYALLAAPKGSINPLDERFVRQRVYLTDILPPAGKTVMGKEFRNCEIIGPANIYISASDGGASEFVGISMINCDAVVIDDGVAAYNCVELRDCSFKSCVFYDVTLIATVPFFEKFRSKMEGINWLNLRLAESRNEKSA